MEDLLEYKENPRNIESQLIDYIMSLRNNGVSYFTIKFLIAPIFTFYSLNADPKTKLQARAIANDCHKYIMDLCTNAGIVSDAMQYVTQKQEQIDTSHKLDDRKKQCMMMKRNGKRKL